MELYSTGFVDGLEDAFEELELLGESYSDGNNKFQPVAEGDVPTSQRCIGPVMYSKKGSSILEI
jgi:hypothetical protein